MKLRDMDAILKWDAQRAITWRSREVGRLFEAPPPMAKNH
jgi:hypothetical protein